MVQRRTFRCATSLLLSKFRFSPAVQAYAPAKLPFGQPHPDSVVETASLAAVEPPDITYQLKVGFQGPCQDMTDCVQLVEESERCIEQPPNATHQLKLGCGGWVWRVSEGAAFAMKPPGK